MKKKFCRGFLALTFTLLCLKIPAQQALKIGETLPESFWTTPLQVVNHPEKTITLDKDRGKLILLDFWNTWCSACLLGFPKMEALQKEFGDQIKVLAVTSQDRPTIEKFFASKNGQRFKDITSITDEPALKKYFPYSGVPFIVWLKDGKLLNTTDGEQVTAEALQGILKGNNEILQTVIQHKGDGPLMVSENLKLERGFTLDAYTFFGRGRIRALGFGSKFHRDGPVIYGRQFYNASLAEIYTTIVGEIFRSRNESFNRKRMVSDLQNEELFYNELNKDQKRNPDALYTFDFILPVSRAPELYPAMLDALNQAAPVTGTLEKCAVSCLVLTHARKGKVLGTKGGNLDFNLRPKGGKLRNASMLDFTHFLNGLTFISMPVLDETGLTDHIDLDLGDISSLSSLRNELEKYGLQLTEETRDIDMLILRDREQSASTKVLINPKP